MRLARKAFTVVAVALVLAPAGIAHADNTNDNSNTNNNSTVGGYLDSGSGSDDSKGWPPTKLDWPPSDMTTDGLSSSGGNGGDGDSGSGKAPPIVMPSGQTAPPKGDDAADSAGSTSPTATPTPTPIVPAGGTNP
jgi:hypothetical protein